MPRATPLGAALDATSGRVLRECAGFLPWSACASGAGPEESRVFDITPATLMAIVICIWGALVSMGRPSKGSGNSGGVAAEVEDIVFIDGERIEIACTYPNVEAAIEALHRGD